MKCFLCFEVSKKRNLASFALLFLKKNCAHLFILNCSGLHQFGLQDAVFENNDSTQKPKRIEVGDEDVDIDDDMPAASFPPVEIEKDEAAGREPDNRSSSSSSSGSSGSDSSSSSGICPSESSFDDNLLMLGINSVGGNCLTECVMFMEYRF